MLSIPASAVTQILLAGFYARHDTVTPFYILVSLLALTFAFDVGLFFMFEARGLALGLSLAKLLGAGLAFYLLQRDVGCFARTLGRFVAKTMGASLAMALATVAAIYLVQPILDLFSIDSRLTAALELLIAGSVGLATYALGTYALRVREVIEVIRLVKAHFARRAFSAKPTG
jgi:putative peptidoglycan lipid II flippase